MQPCGMKEDVFVCLETTAMESLNSELQMQMTLSLLGIYFYLNMFDICSGFCWIPATFLTAVTLPTSHLSSASSPCCTDLHLRKKKKKVTLSFSYAGCSLTQTSRGYVPNFHKVIFRSTVLNKIRGLKHVCFFFTFVCSTKGPIQVFVHVFGSCPPSAPK